VAIEVKKLRDAMAELSSVEEAAAPSVLQAEPAPRYPCSSLADPPITPAEARAVNPAVDTTLCRLHGGQLTHLLVDGGVYLCARGQMLFRNTKRPNESLRPQRYR
jgi:hypothetical protein